MGSAFGGSWQPFKEEDNRLLGEPGEIKQFTRKNGDRYETQIGEDGRAIMERHYTDYDRPWAHSDPHDHIVEWNPQTGEPIFVKPHINYPDGATEFKKYRRNLKVGKIIQSNTPEQNRFVTISDFKWCMKCGGEVEFEWNGKKYSITHPDGLISICEGNKYLEAEDYDTADKALEYIIDGKRLREIIIQVKVWARTI